MGVYDFITTNLTCPHCGKPTTFSCQIKWQSYNMRKFANFDKGDRIFAVDAIYTGASCVRDTINDTCDKCGEWIHVNVVVKDGYIKDIYAVDNKGELEDANSKII